MNSHHRISNDRAVHPLRVSYSDQRNHQPRIFNSGCPRCDRYCPYYGTLRGARSMALMIVSAVPFLSGSIEWIAIEAGCAGPALHAKLLGGGSATLVSAC